MKTCSKCGEEKDLSAFSKNKVTKDGLQYYCKQCTNDQIRAYRATPAGAAKEKERQQKRHARDRENILARYKHHKSLHPERTKANSAVKTALRRGELTPASACECNDCRATAAQDLHHHSYQPEHWLDVVPLCRSCHRIRHAYPERFQ